jgi:hypothetical protein
MNSKTKYYVLPVFAAVFALMFATATPYVTAEPGQQKDWADSKKDIRQDMAEKLNAYCQMTPEEQAALIAEHDKSEEMVAKMNEYCSLDDAGRQAFIDEHKDQYRKHSENKMGHDDKKHHMMIVEVEDFTGKIKIPEMSEIKDIKSTHEEMKSQVNVKLSQAAAKAEEAGLDIMKGSIGMVVNQDGVKSVAWILVAMNMDDNADSEKISKTIFVVDAADINNTAQITKEMDHPMTEYKDKRYDDSHKDKYDNNLANPERIQDKIAKIEEKLATGTGNPDVDAAKTKFLEVLKQLQDAIANGDNAQADSLREQLKDLRNQMLDMKKFR